MKIALIILAVAAGLSILLEVLLRLLLGFGNPLIYMADDECGYLLAPSQKVRRLRNRIEINQYSMRAGAIDPRSPAGRLPDHAGGASDADAARRAGGRGE